MGIILTLLLTSVVPWGTSLHLSGSPFTALAKTIKGPSCSTGFLKRSCFQSLHNLCLRNREDVTGPKPEGLVNQVV